MKSRDLLRAEAKKEYKKQTKGIPKANRMPFAQFFKKYKASKNDNTKNDNEIVSDFDFDDLVNVNDINDIDEGDVDGQQDV